MVAIVCVAVSLCVRAMLKVRVMYCEMLNGVFFECFCLCASVHLVL